MHDDSEMGATFLRGLRVLELGDHVAGATATSVLRSLGASVSTVPEPGSLLRRLEPRADGPDGRSVLSMLLDEGKTILECESFASIDAFDAFDIVVCDRVGGAPASLPWPSLDYLRLVQGRRAGAWVTITPHGLQGRRGDWRGSELTVSAACGLLHTVRDPRTGRPIRLAGNQGLIAAGHAAALAACHAVDLARRRDAAVHLDLSAQEAGIATGPVLACGLALLNCSGASGARRYGAPAGNFETSDGLIRISAMEDHQWQGLIRALDQPSWAITYATANDRIERADDIDAALVPLIGKLTKMDCERRLQAEGVPATAMYTMSELLNLEQFATRHAVRTADVEGAHLRSVGAPFVVTEPAAAATRAAGGPHSLQHLRVLEVGHVLAAPLASALLGAMGASVIKVEDPQRMDMYRRRGPYVDGTAGLNRAAYFALMNHSKRSLTIDLEQDRTAVDDLLGNSDVVIENLGPSRATRLGLDAARLNREHPHMLALSSSGYGHTGPLSRYRTYAYNLHTSCGLVYLTRTPDGGAVTFDMAWADLITGYALATVAAAWAVSSDRDRGAAVDFSMAELVAGRFNEYLAAHDAGLGGDPDDGSNRQAPYAPGGVYQVGGDRWIAISVDGDAGWVALRAVLGEPPALGRAEFATGESRWLHHAALDDCLVDLLSDLDAGALTEGLQAAGVAASPVLSAPDLVNDQDLAARGFFGEVVHPEWGARRVLGLPWQAIGEGAFPLTAAPLLGELTEMLAARGSQDPFGLVDATATRG